MQKASFAVAGSLFVSIMVQGGDKRPAVGKLVDPDKIPVTIADEEAFGPAFENALSTDFFGHFFECKDNPQKGNNLG